MGTRPTRPDKARRLGYKAKQGFCIYRARAPRWTQTTGGEGSGVREAGALRYHEVEVCAQLAIGRGGTRGATMRRFASVELVLVEPRLGVQVLRGDHGGPDAQVRAQRPAHQLDLQPDAQAPRNARSHVRGAQVPWLARQGSQLHQVSSVQAGHLEKQQPLVLPSLPLEKRVSKKS